MPRRAKKKKTIAEFLMEMQEKEERRKKRWTSLQIIVPGFLGIILLGALFLMFPVCNADGRWLNFTDALFTSCTCVCVTGLTTVVPAVQFALPGKIVMLFLIQIGGWGVIVCAMWFLVLLKRRISLHARVIIRDYFNMDTMSGLVRMLIYVVKSSIVVESVGAVCYALYFVPRYGFWRGCWYGGFHSVSAFCNAGIDILGDSSLTAFRGNIWINLVTMALIILGGLGFMVWRDLANFLKKIFVKRETWKKAARETKLQTKLVGMMTAGLLVAGTLLIFGLEHDNPETLGSLPLGEKWLAALFQSVTTRTAGFFTISQSGLREATKLLCCILMFIGGSPVGTAGGVKTVTVAVLLLTCWSIMKGHRDTECFHRKVADSTVRMAVVVFAVGLMLTMAGTIAISALEPGVSAMDGLYEVVSATATVGLTTGITPGLSAPGKYVIIFLMYLGRIGPITLPMMMAAKLGKKNVKRTLPEEHIVVG